MFEQTFKNIDDILHKDAGCGSELDYVEQTSWVLFLKYLDDLERDRATAAELTGKTYTTIIDKEYQWNNWAAPKITNGGGALKIDHNALTGDDLTDFVNNKLFPYLKKFKLSAESADTIEYKIGEIFSELKNRIQSGYNLREVINRIDELRFRTHAEKHEMSHLYEDKIKNMGNAGRNGGEYYTPRPLITTIVKVVAPKIGDKIYEQVKENITIEIVAKSKPEAEPYSLILPWNYSKEKADEILNFRETISAKLLSSKVFSGFAKSCHDKYKFDSIPEKRFSEIIENSDDVIKWLRPASKQFNIWYNNNSYRYVPDFVAETENTIYLIEIKAENELEDKIVKLKEEAAINYCKNATEINKVRKEKTWKYAIIPHDKTDTNMTFKKLVTEFGK